MVKSDYIYRFFNLNGKKFILIEDLNLGGMSVTNDIERVIQSICSKESIHSQDYFFIYKDSEGMWDGWDVRSQQFIYLQQKDYLSAAKAYAKRADAIKEGA